MAIVAVPVNETVQALVRTMFVRVNRASCFDMPFDFQMDHVLFRIAYILRNGSTRSLSHTQNDLLSNRTVSCMQFLCGVLVRFLTAKYE